MERMGWLPNGCGVGSRTEAAAERRLPSNRRGRIRANSRMGALRPQRHPFKPLHRRRSRVYGSLAPRSCDPGQTAVPVVILVV